MHFKVGQKIKICNGNDHIEIMAIVKGYVMARRKGAMPFCTSIIQLKTFINDNK